MDPRPLLEKITQWTLEADEVSEALEVQRKLLGKYQRELVGYLATTFEFSQKRCVTIVEQEDLRWEVYLHFKIVERSLENLLEDRENLVTPSYEYDYEARENYGEVVSDFNFVINGQKQKLNGEISNLRDSWESLERLLRNHTQKVGSLQERLRKDLDEITVWSRQSLKDLERLVTKKRKDLEDCEEELRKLETEGKEKSQNLEGKIINAMESPEIKEGLMGLTETQRTTTVILASWLGMALVPGMIAKDNKERREKLERTRGQLLKEQGESLVGRIWNQRDGEWKGLKEVLEPLIPKVLLELIGNYV